MKICIVGGGNIGTAMAVELSAKNHVVNIFTSKPEKWNKEIFAVDIDGAKLFSGNLNLLTDNFLMPPIRQIIFLLHCPRMFSAILQKKFRRL